jgi:hypothetical protein
MFISNFMLSLEYFKRHEYLVANYLIAFVAEVCVDRVKPLCL